MVEKSDPSTAALAAGIAAASPLAGEYAIILVVALFGSLGALSLKEKMTRRDAMWFIFRSVTIATVMASLAATLISKMTGTDYRILLAPVAFVIAWMADRWPEFLAATAAWAQSRRPKS